MMILSGGTTIFGSGGSAVYTDPNFSNVSLLLSGGGINGGQNNTFLDSSGNNLAITRNGNVTQGTFSPFSAEPGKWSNYFDGNGAYLTLPSNNALTFGTGDFTVEAWIYLTTTAQPQTIISADNGVPGGFLFRLGRSTSGLNIAATGVADMDHCDYTFSPRVWYHVAVTRASSTIKFYINGARQSIVSGSGGDTYNYTVTSAVGIGYIPGYTEFFNGSITNLRVVKGIAVYTGNFTPPSKAPLATSGADSIAAYPSTTNVNTTFAYTACSLLTCQDNRFKDNSPNNFTLTPYGDVKVTPTSPFAPSIAYTPSVHGGSGYFDGNGDVLTIPSLNLNPRTDTWTFETWFYPLHGGNHVIFSSSDDATYIHLVNGTDFYVAYNYDNLVWVLPKVGRQWYHIAVTSLSGTATVYVNGESLGSQIARTSDRGVISGYQIGARLAGGFDPTNSYFSDLRLLRGTTLYTANFTPPTAPLTAITNTALLCNFTQGNIIDYSRKNNLETVGNAQVSTTTKKFGTGSLCFDGTGDWLLVDASSVGDYTFGTGDFTIEFRLYLNSTSTQYIYSMQASNSYQTAPDIYVNSGGQLRLQVSNNGSVISGGILAISTWYHIALCRASGQTKLFINGSQTGSTYTDTNNYVCPSGRPIIGTYGYNTAVGNLNGYIDELRVTKGIARYPSSPVPTAAFPRQ